MTGRRTDNFPHRPRPRQRRQASRLSALPQGGLQTTLTPVERLRHYPTIFRAALQDEYRLCLGSFMAAEFDDLPEVVKCEIISFSDANIAWIDRQLIEACLADHAPDGGRARAIYAAVTGAQLLARGRSDTALYDSIVESYRIAGLLP